jgi:molybdenum cofactor synthesis domain-containing protein
MTTGKLLHICISAEKGIPKHETPSANIVVGHGMEGDAHAGEWHRQLSLLAHVDIEYMRAKGLTLKPGAFGENLVIAGVDTDELGVGSQLRVGPVLLELMQIGKVCHTRCAIYYKTGDCIMPRAGLFGRVLEGGTLHPYMPVEVVRMIPRSLVQAAVITISDRCAEGETRDAAGPAIAELLRKELRVHITCTQTVPDEVELIAQALTDLCDRRVDLVITVGGTGMTVRDVTPEATRKVLDRELPGLAEAMRLASAKKTPNAMLSRAVAGVRCETLIVNVPGSLKAATENIEAILPALPHAVMMLWNETAHPETDKERLITLNTEPAVDSLVEGR